MTTSPDGTGGLALLEPLLGAWAGVSTGSFGSATLSRVSEYVLQDRFIRVVTESVAEKDAHEDIAFFSYDRETGTIVLREFHAEGYVIRYRLVSADGGVFVFESEEVENPFDPTLRARTVIRLSDPVVETLELATKQGPFKICVEARFERAPSASQSW